MCIILIKKKASLRLKHSQIDPKTSSHIKRHTPNLMLVIGSVHRWSIHSSGTIGSVSGARKEPLELLLGEWEMLCLFGDWLWLEMLNLCTPEKECTPKAGEWARLWKKESTRQLAMPAPWHSFPKPTLRNRLKESLQVVHVSTCYSSPYTYISSKESILLKQS